VVFEKKWQKQLKISLKLVKKSVSAKSHNNEKSILWLLLSFLKFSFKKVK